MINIDTYCAMNCLVFSGLFEIVVPTSSDQHLQLKLSSFFFRFVQHDFWLEKELYWQIPGLKDNKSVS